MAAVGDARKRAAEKSAESAGVEALIQLWLTLGWSLRGETARENTAALFLSSDWLAAHTAAARAEALRDAADVAERGEITGLETTRPRLVAIWLRARAGREAQR